MKREILFRGRTDGGVWVEGDLIHGVGTKSGKMYILPRTLVYPKGCSELDGWNVHPDTVGQFTGLTDKNGKRIFEGDVVDSWADLSKPYFREVVYGKNCGLEFNPLTGFTLCKSNEHHFSIIGNIHDNPELI